MNPLRTRRSFLRAIAAAGTVPIAGCAAFAGRETKNYPRLGELKALNVDDESHTVHVRVELDGETVYRQSKRLQSADGGAVAVLFADYPSNPGAYEVYAWKDKQSRSDAQSLDLAGFDADCVGVQVKIGTYGAETEEPHLSIYSTTNCPDETSA